MEDKLAPRPPLLTFSQPALPCGKTWLRSSVRFAASNLVAAASLRMQQISPPRQYKRITVRKNRTITQEGKGVSMGKQTTKLRSKIERRVLLSSRSAAELTGYLSKHEEGGRRRGLDRRRRG